jgi:MFS transporter, ACS family, glucarate transporter
MKDETAAPVLSYSDEGRATHVRWKVMAFLCVLSFLTYFDRFCIVEAQNHMVKDLALQPGQMGWALGAFWLAYALFEIPGGWLGDRYGARGSLARIVLAWSLFTALSGSATGFYSLLAYRFLFGVGEAGAFPNMARVMAAWLPTSSRARWGGLIWLMARWGGAFSPIIVGHLIRAFDTAGFRDMVSGTFLQNVASWRLGFWASGLMGVAWVALFYPFFRNRPSDKRGVNRAELDLINRGRAQLPDGGDAESHAAPPRGLWGSLFTSRSLWALAFLYLCVSFGWSFFASWIPKYFEQVQKKPFQQSEWLRVFPLFCGGISCLVGGTLCDYLVRRTGRKRLMRALFPICGYMVAALGFVGLRWASTPLEATIIFCVIASASDFGQGANWASIVDIGGRYAGIATGLINTIGNLGHFTSPPLGEWLYRTFSWDALFVVYASAFCVAALLWLIIDPTKRFYREESETPRGFEVVKAQ